LDISCGSGYGSKIYREAEATKVFGIDISSEPIDFAQTHYQIKGLEFKVGNILDIDFPETYFDLITCFETIEHIQSQEKALKELCRVLKPKGLLIISNPNRKLTSPGKSINEPPNNPFHVVEYTMQEFIQLLRNYFEILEVYGQRALPKVLLLPFVQRLLRRILPWLYSPEKGKAELETVSSKKEYRYITVVCKKSETDKP
jgi:ubiquinone/menaquinone biosynthesis C-methylase UbiE